MKAKVNVYWFCVAKFKVDYQPLMKKVLVLVVLFAVCLSCGPKPAYKTAEGKKKQKYYNNLQFGGDPQAVPPPKEKRKKN